MGTTLGPCRMAANDKEWDKDIICPAFTVTQMLPNTARVIVACT